MPSPPLRKARCLVGLVYKQAGRKTWMLKYYRDGVPIVESARTTEKRQAEKQLKLKEAAILDGKRITPKGARLTFADAFADVRNDYVTNGRRSLEHVERRARLHLLPVFGLRRMADISTQDIRAYSTDRLDAGASPASVNRELAIIKRTFTLAVQAGRIAQKPHIPMLAEHNVRQGFFEDDQLAAVLKHLPPYLRPVIEFAGITGWRVPSEVLTLQWHQVDLDGRLSPAQDTPGIVRLEPGTTKNQEARVFPCTPALRAVLVEQHAESKRRQKAGEIVPWVFHRDGEPIVTFKKSWRAACKAAGCPGRIPHDLRRSAVRNLVRAGISEGIAMRLTGHKTRSVFERYNIVSGADLASAAAKLAAHGATTSQRKG